MKLTLTKALAALLKAILKNNMLFHIAESMMTRLSYIGECSMLWEWSTHLLGCIVQVIIISLVQGRSSQRKLGESWMSFSFKEYFSSLVAVGVAVVKAGDA